MKVFLCALVCCITAAAVAGRAQSDLKIAAENKKNKIDRKRLCDFWHLKETPALPALLSGLPPGVKKGTWEFFDKFYKGEYAKNEIKQVPLVGDFMAQPEEYTTMKINGAEGVGQWIMGAYKVENDNLMIMFFVRSPENKSRFFRPSQKVEGKTVIYEAKIVKVTDKEFQTKDANGDCLEFIKEK